MSPGGGRLGSRARQRKLLRLTAAVCVVLAVAAGVVAVDVAGILSPAKATNAGGRVVVVPNRQVPAPPPTSTTIPPQVPVSTVLAIPGAKIPTFTSPGAAATGTTGTWYGYPLVLPVIAEQTGWLEVRLPQRPNQSTAWVRSGDVTLSSSPYRIVVRLTTQDLIVYRSGYRILAFPVGLGVPATPTPTGSYFVTVKVPPPSPGYGPFVISTSAHSPTITSWEGAGDAIIAIHGPITSSADSSIGATGTRISNGCIRLHDSDLAQLAMIPPGTPVDIVG